jgi:protein tyrosine phosphatase
MFECIYITYSCYSMNRITSQQIVTKIKDTQLELINQFESIPQNPLQNTTNDAILNIYKNNYSNNFPYDITRVILKTCYNDYINASWIFGNTYIATQYPQTSTVDSFWAMIFETNSSIIVNLGCDNDYLPDKQQIFLSITVKIINIQYCESFTIIKLQLECKGINDIIIVHHISYNNWPDFGIPSNEQDMILLTNMINILNNNRTIVVHCKAGLGRTGTFIGIHHILTKIEKGEYDNDFIEIVHKMRHSRIGMVQTKQQFSYIIDVVCHKINSINNSSSNVVNNMIINNTKKRKLSLSAPSSINVSIQHNKNSSKRLLLSSSANQVYVKVK